MTCLKLAEVLAVRKQLVELKFATLPHELRQPSAQVCRDARLPQATSALESAATTHDLCKVSDAWAGHATQSETSCLKSATEDRQKQITSLPITLGSSLTRD